MTSCLTGEIFRLLWDMGEFGLLSGYNDVFQYSQYRYANYAFRRKSRTKNL